jgi:hypothetical protein
VAVDRVSKFTYVMDALANAGLADHVHHSLDSTVIRAHQHAAGAKGGNRSEALGRSRGGFSVLEAIDKSR